jgi:twinkle protein
MHSSKIKQLFINDDGLCAEGRLYLTDRGLNIPVAQRAGIASQDGKIYFAYTYNGEIVRWKYRSMSDKKDTRFNLLSDEEKEKFKMPFYNQQNWPTSDFLIITEGEFDCIALLQLMGSNVVSLPNGAGSLESTFRNQYEYLQQFDKIYLCLDMDEAGDLADKKAMTLLSPTKYRRIMLPCKDANEWVLKNPEVEKKDLEIFMRNAKRIEDQSFVNMAFLDSDYYEAIDLGVSTGWKGLDLILGGLRKGELTVVSADTGSGKSTFCMNLIHNIAQQGLGIWINSYEMDSKIVNRKLASIVLKKQFKYEKFLNEDVKKYKEWLGKKHCYINQDNSQVDIGLLRKQFEAASYAYGINYILIDHFDYIHGAGNKATSLENIDEAIREIHSLAMEFNVAVILVVHPKQVQSSTQELTMSDLKGSSSIKQYADNIIILTRMDRLDPMDVNRVKIRVWKNRLYGVEKSFFLRYLSEIDGYVEGI